MDILRSEGLGLEMSQGLEEEVMEVIDRLGVESEHDSSQENRETVLSKCTICNQNKNNTRCNFCNDKGKWNVKLVTFENKFTYKPLYHKNKLGWVRVVV